MSLVCERCPLYSVEIDYCYSYCDDVADFNKRLIDEFAEKLTNWKPNNEEYVSFKDAISQVTKEMKEKYGIDEGLGEE